MSDLRRILGEALERPGEVSSDVFGLGRIPEGEARGAAVLLVFDPVCEVLYLTKRGSALKHHPGQIALPGGKIDPVDQGPVDAALREAREEIGLPAHCVEVLGLLPTHRTVTGFDVTPVLALQTACFGPVAEAGEVDEIFTVPASHVLDPRRYRTESRIWNGASRSYLVAPYGPYYLWGATARILHSLAQRTRL